MPGHLQDAVEFLLILLSPPLRVVDVLGASGIIRAGGLDVTPGIGADPRVLPRGGIARDVRWSKRLFFFPSGAE